MFTFPDIAFTPFMQLLLFLVKMAMETMASFFIISLLLSIIKKPTSIKRKLIFSTICAFFSNIIITYAVALVNGYMRGLGRLHLGELLYVATTPPPFMCFVFYYLGRKILKLPVAKCISIMGKIYILCICCILYMSIGKKILPDLTYVDPRGYNSLYEIIKLLIFFLPLYLLFLGLYLLVKKLGYSSAYPDNISVENIPLSMLKRFLLCCVIYAIAIFTLYYPNLDTLHVTYLFVILAAFFLFTLVLDFNKIQQTLIINQHEHITELNRSIEEFRGIRHDFNNIIQTFGGYIAIGDYAKLEKYYIKMAGDMQFSQSYMDFSKRIPENPPFFYLLIRQLNRAKELNINFDARSICNIEDVFIDPLDFSRIMSIFLDNALDEAAKIPGARVSFSVQKTKGTSKLFIITNDTQGSIDIDQIFLPGYSTKAGHSGQGLAQVRLTLSKYNNSILNCTSYNNRFNVYLELKPPMALALPYEAKPLDRSSRAVRAFRYIGTNNKSL